MRSWRDRLYGPTFALPLFVWQVVFFLAPLLFLIALSFWTVQNFRITPGFETENWVRMLSRDVFWGAYRRTALYSAGAAALTSILAFPCSYAIAFRLSDKAKRWALFLMVIPFFTSYLVRVYSWQVFLADNGIINAAIDKIGLGPWPMLNTAFGTFIGYLTLCFPLVVLLQLSSLMFVDRTLIAAAHNLRCGPLKTVFLIVIPAAKVGLVIGALFAFILTFGDFAGPLYLGGGKATTLSLLITDTTKAGNQWPRAAVIAVVMILTLLIVAFSAVSYAYRNRAR